MMRTPSLGGSRMGKHRHQRTVSGSTGTGVTGGVASIRLFFVALLVFLGISFALSILYRAGWFNLSFDGLSWPDPHDLRVMRYDDSLDVVNLDADIMWFRNPFPYFDQDADFQIACDHFTGDSRDLRNIANGGFGYVRSNNRTIEFYKFWYSSRFNYPGYHDQHVLNFIKYDEFLADIRVDMLFLSTTHFGGICEPSRDFEKVCTMHANCCIGLKSKMHDLKVILEDWRYYLSLPTNWKKASDFSWHIPQNCSLNMLNKSRPPMSEIERK